MYNGEPECGTCNGTSWVMIAADDGKEYARKCPDCTGGIRRNKLLEMTGRKKMITWTAVNPEINGMRAAMEKLKSFPGSEFLKFFISGNPGGGKTMLAEILFYELGMNGRKCFFSNMRDIRTCNAKLHGYGIDAMERIRWTEYQQGLIDASFTFIDGLDCKLSESLSSFLEFIVDERDKRELKTIFTSRCTPFDNGNKIPVLECDAGLLSHLYYRADSAYLCCQDYRSLRRKPGK